MAKSNNKKREDESRTGGVGEGGNLSVRGKTGAKKSGGLRCLKATPEGLRTARDVTRFTMALAMDVIDGHVKASQGNAAANIIGKGLKAAEMEHKYGTTLIRNTSGEKRELLLTD